MPDREIDLTARAEGKEAQGGRPIASRLLDAVQRGLSRQSEREAATLLLEVIEGEHQVEFASLCRALDDGSLAVVASVGISLPDLAPDGRVDPVRGFLGQAFRTGRPIVVDEALDEPNWFDVSDGRSRSGMFVPLRLDQKAWGILAVESPDPSAFSVSDAEAIMEVGGPIAWGLETLRLRDEATERAEREARLRQGLEATAQVITVGLEAKDEQSAIDRMVREIRERFGWESLGVVLRRDDDLEVVSYYGWEDQLAGTRLPTSTGIIGHVLMTGRTYLAPDVHKDPFYNEVVSETRSEMCAPLVIAGQVRGLLNAEAATLGAFDELDLDLLRRIADQMALVMHNLELLGTEKDTVARLHELDRLKSRILSIASHELRTPLTVVMGFSEVLAEHADQLPREQLTDYAAMINKQASSLTRLVDQMLLAAQMEQGALNVVAGPVALEEVVSEARQKTSERIEVLPGVVGVRVVADPFRLRQVFENLFDNALKYATEGRIQVDARVAGKVATVLVRDEGPGIPGSEHARVLEAFEQVGEHGVAGRRGVGLGLAVARDLLALMGGELMLASASGYGVTVTLRLPIAD